MKEFLHREIMERLPCAYAYHRVIYDDGGSPEDYIFLDVNSAFEEMTGFKKEDILGKRATEVLPGLREGNFDWVDFYGRLTRSGREEEFVQYADAGWKEDRAP
jgi:PAS domain S-box-containing protein